VAELGTFALDLSRLVDKAKRNMAAVVRKVVIDLGEAIVEDTPVGDPDTWKGGRESAPPGYVGGRARGSWQYGHNAPNATEGPLDSTGASTLGRLEAGVRSHPALGGVHYVTSTVPYMRRLEYEAWSAQAPEGMVRKNILSFQQHLDAAAREVNR